jgi:thiamine biosynthesis lipoprotein
MQHAPSRLALRIATWTLGPILVAAALSPAVTAAATKRYEFSAQHMGTQFVLTFYAPSDEVANGAADRAFARIAELNQVFSDYDESSESRRMAAAGEITSSGVTVSEPLWLVLEEAVRMGKVSEGAFDVTVGSLTQIWRRARRRQELPDAEKVAEARALVGYEKIGLVDASVRRVRLAQPGMRLDFGGIAKGYAADEALRMLREAGCGAALIDAGGDLVLGDPPPGRRGWQVGVAALGEKNGADRVLEMARCGIATSGDAWQYVELAGERFSHILDPRTGWPLKRRMGVTVIAPSGMAADALASAVSVLGPAEGLQLIERIDDTEAIFVEATGATQTKGFPALPQK